METIASIAVAAATKGSTGGKSMELPRTKPAPEREIVKFRLYVADHSPNSVLARANLSTLCALHLPDQHEIEVVDVFFELRRASDDGIIMTPTLIKISPLPVRKVVGALRHAESVMAELGLATATA